ncbi:MAG: hypothetical protein HRU03_06880 [Nanoarchaeales archaeon]|nr:hypothetical protein [Nanoarchaeales archaeon]
MENKFKKATRRITAVAATALMVSSSVFGASLSDYPQNFVSSGEFDGQVVIGGNSDAAAATSVISDLKSDLMGGEKVKITAKMAASGSGAIMSAIDSKETLNFGEKLEDVAEDLDDSTNILLDDEELDGDKYTQTLTLKNGRLEYDIFDDLDETVARHGLVYDGDAAYAEYVIDFSDMITDAGTTDTTWEDLVGESMMIMGNEFTVISLSDTQLELVGGSNKISLGEGESTTVSVDGVSYEIMIQSVSSSSSKEEVLLTVNGETVSIDQGDVEDVSGVTIAVTDLVPSSRDSIKGYASLVVGGQKINFEPGKVEINDEDFTDIYPDYDVTATFDSIPNTFDTLTITYKVDEFTSLKDGDSLIDPLFDSFMLTYNGLNNVEYSEFNIRSGKDEIKFSGNIHDGNSVPSEFKLTTDDTSTGQLYLGSDKKRIYHKGSDLSFDTIKFDDGYSTGITNTGTVATTGVVAARTFTTNLNVTANLKGTGGNSITLEIIANTSTTNGVDSVVVTGTAIVVNAHTVGTVTNLQISNAINNNADAAKLVKVTGESGTAGVAQAATALQNGANLALSTNSLAKFSLSVDDSDVQSNMFFSRVKDDDFFLYEIGGIDKVDFEADFKDLFASSTESNVDMAKLVGTLDLSQGNPLSGYNNSFNITTLNLGLSELYLENELIMDFTNVEHPSLMSTADTSRNLIFKYHSDIEMDDTADGYEDNKFEISFARDASDFDTDAIHIKLSSLVNNFIMSTDVVEDSDFEISIDHYGTRVTVDTDDFSSIKIEVPNKEVQGLVDINFGGAAPQVSTYTVDKASADAKVKQLEDDGYTVTTETVSTMAVSFDITAPVMASDVTGMSDMVVIGGPAANMVAAKLLGVPFPSFGEASGLEEGEAVVRYFSNSNSVLVYGWDAAGTVAAANKLNSGGLSGSSVDVQ